MLICFRTLQMERLELNSPLTSACLQDQEFPRSMCPAYHSVNGHDACCIFKRTIMHAQTAGEKITTSANPEHWCPLNHGGCKDTYAVLAFRKHSAVYSHRPEYPFSECRCRMDSSPGLFSKGSRFKLRPEMEYCDRKRSYFSSVPQDKRRCNT
jgi:hypothetical protein